MPAANAVILFDGTCAFCEASVKFIARHDRHERFRFGASQSPQGEVLLAAHGLTRALTRSIVLIEDGQVFLRSDATLRIARALTWPWSMAGALLVIPRPVRDTAYRVIAAIRHRVAGTSNACEVPPPELRKRMI
jgi:predicted DCC family thiol-disulfide oxidoreductase YuxK